jgi:hypothetical protein
MPVRTEQERLLIHETVAVTVDTIIAAIQAEMVTARELLGIADGTFTRAEVARREGIIEGLRIAEGAAAVASVAARAAATHVERQVA